MQSIVFSILIEMVDIDFIPSHHHSAPMARKRTGAISIVKHHPMHSGCVTLTG